MRTDYATVITETADELRAAEVRVRGERVAPRARMLVLLKTGTTPTLARCAEVLGFSPRGVARWWAAYRREGLAGLLVQRPRQGRRPRLTAPALAGLEAVMATGAIATLKDAQRYLAEEWGIVYPSLNGVWSQLHKHRIKLKTGRRRHQRADAAAQAAFKAGFRPGPGGAPGDPGVGV
jgi:transposase